MGGSPRSFTNVSIDPAAPGGELLPGEFVIGSTTSSLQQPYPPLSNGIIAPLSHNRVIKLS